MEQTKNKNSILAVVLLLTLSASIAFSASLQAKAATEGWKQTYAFLGASPNPVGVGQQVLLHVGISDPYETGDGWKGLSVTVMKPDGTSETISDITTDASGGIGVIYVPTQEGNYTLQSHFPEQWWNFSGRSIFGTPVESNILYKASDSEKMTLVVQESPVPTYPSMPLPTEYWTRPINSQLRDWTSIGGNWLESWDANPKQNMYFPGNDMAPESAHVLWTKPLRPGGVVGAPTENGYYQTGEAYEGQFSGSLTINGVLYYNEYASSYATAAKRVHAVDLRTGEELWSKDGIWINRGQLLTFSTENQHGTFAYLWVINGTMGMFGPPSGAPWNIYDAFSGDLMYTMTDIPSGTVMRGPSGEILILQINLARGWMALWNSTSIPALRGGAYGTWLWNQWRPWGKTVNATGPCAVTPETPLGISGYSWNVTIPQGLPGSVVEAYPEDIALGYSRGATVINQVTIGDVPFYAWAVSLKPETRGQLLWNKTFPLPPGNLTLTNRYGPQDDQSRVWAIWLKETRQWVGYSLDTGEKLWGPTDPQVYQDQYTTIGATWGINSAIAYGRLYSIHYGGTLYCYNVTTGKLLWTYQVKDPYGEEGWSTNFPSDISIISDGKVYLTAAKFNPPSPRPRGEPMLCVDAYTGELIWSIPMPGPATSGHAIIGDNIIATLNEYDNQIYAIGKGPSATTVSASPKVSMHGSSVVVEGMVTDISAGTKDTSLAMRFPHGVPAVSDDSMSAWMEYIYMQLPHPKNATGVEVVISVLDPNNNAYEVARTTSESNGYFKAAFTPEVPGEYFVYATFEGSEGYWPSHDVTAINVEDVPVVPVPTPEPESVADLYFVPMSIGTIVAIIVVGLLLFLLLRKR